MQATKSDMIVAWLQVVQAIESYITASLQFLQGLLQSFELLATLREHRDRFIAGVLPVFCIKHSEVNFPAGHASTHGCCLAGDL